MDIETLIENKKNKTVFSFIDHLRKQDRLYEELEIAINSFSLEELIAIKLELSSQFLNGKYFFPLRKKLPRLVEEALLIYALSVSKAKLEASMIMGVTFETFKHLLRSHPRANKIYRDYNKAWAAAKKSKKVNK